MDTEQISSKAYVVAVDMGYGHQRAIFSLLERSVSPVGWGEEREMIISANNYEGIPVRDRLRWESTRKFYEWASRMRSFPILGKYIFQTMDHFQKIEPFYPKRDLSKPRFQTRQIYHMIKKGLGKHLINELNKKPLPYITSFFMTAFFAEEHGYKDDIYCLCTDTDISRAWAPLYPEKSRIIYLAPNQRVKERLMMYGVLESKIVLTGFPLPKMNVEEPLARRIKVLDPLGLYKDRFKDFALSQIGANDPITLTFAVGGAGAQAEIADQILTSFKQDIIQKKIRINLVAGVSLMVKMRFEFSIKMLGLSSCVGNGIHIVYDANKFEYFKLFNGILSITDVLWTKPSELSFYSGLGLPIIIAPTLGSQEECNRSWLSMVGSGLMQEDPRYSREWFFDCVDSGWFAQAAVNGIINAPRHGTDHIEDLLFKNRKIETEHKHFL